MPAPRDLCSDHYRCKMAESVEQECKTGSVSVWRPRTKDGMTHNTPAAYGAQTTQGDLMEENSLQDGVSLMETDGARPGLLDEDRVDVFAEEGKV